jgi:gamma-glutamyltranspeptidase/glutathione hydrolase
MGISVAGGDVQDQTTLNCLLNFIEFGMMPENAVTAPRFKTGHHQDSFKSSANRSETYVTLSGLTLNNTISEEVRNQLAARGHLIDTTNSAIANPVMIYLDPVSRVIYAAGDPKSRRHAAALETTSPDTKGK